MSTEDIKKLIRPRKYTTYSGNFSPNEEHFSSFIAAGYKIKQPASREEWNAKHFAKNYFSLKRRKSIF